MRQLCYYSLRSIVPTYLKICRQKLSNTCNRTSVRQYVSAISNGRNAKPIIHPQLTNNQKSCAMPYSSRIGFSGSNTKEDSDDSSVPDSAWIARLANENGYLSWCRNTYLASAVACGMQAEGMYAASQVAAQGVFILAGLNLLWGTTSFCVHVLVLRRRVHMSYVASVFNIGGAVVHLLIWFVLVTMYLGIVSDDDPDIVEQLELPPCEPDPPKDSDC